MKRITMVVSGFVLAAGLVPAWVQHGHGVGLVSHGAPPQFSDPARVAPKAVTPSAVVQSRAASASMGSRMPVANRIAANPALASRIQLLLPAGVTLQSAATGFSSQDRFLAALHVSKNLNIPFSQLKAEMTGADHDSLAKAIQDLRPGMDRATIKSSVKTARLQAQQDTQSAVANPAAVAMRIAQRPVLDTRVVALLPSGMTLPSAASGFASTGQFIATLHVAHNLNIPFSQLKAEVTSGIPLGQAVSELRPALSPGIVKTDLRLAESQARQDLVAGDEVELVSER
jgi:hypothetical protein